MLCGHTPARQSGSAVEAVATVIAGNRTGRLHSSLATSVLRLVGTILAEQDDEWQDGRRYFRPETLALIDAEPESEEVVSALLVAS